MAEPPSNDDRDAIAREAAQSLTLTTPETARAAQSGVRIQAFESDRGISTGISRETHTYFSSDVAPPGWMEHWERLVPGFAAAYVGEWKIKNDHARAMDREKLGIEKERVRTPVILERTRIVGMVVGVIVLVGAGMAANLELAVLVGVMQVIGLLLWRKRAAAAGGQGQP